MAPIPAAFADANVLYSTALRDILIELALEHVIRLHWSPGVLDELDRAILKARPSTPAERLASRRAAMNAALPQASVTPAADLMLQAVLPDHGDAHVLAAALAAGCTVLLTFNVRHFPAEQLVRDDPSLVAVHPDSFMIELLTTRAASVVAIIEAVRKRLLAPPMSRPAYLAALARAGLPQTAELLRQLQQS